MGKQIKLLGLDEVAECLSLSLHTVRRWASERRLPIVKIGRRVLVDEADLTKFIDSRRVAARRDIPL